jgi:hypothetical protein
MCTYDAPTLRLKLASDPVPNLAGDPVAGLSGDSGPSTVQTSGVEPLLFGLSLAAALPPTAILFPPDSLLPVVRSEPHPIVGPAELSAILARPTALVGRGRIELEEVDRRMASLVVSLEVFQVTDGSGVLISLGVVRPHRTDGGIDGATTADLWELACEALPRYAGASQYPSRIGGGARLVVYGGITAQVAWLADGCLMTASVTSLGGDDDWAIEAASAIALALDRRRRQR